MNRILQVSGLLAYCICYLTLAQAQHTGETNEIRGIILDRNSDAVLPEVNIELLNVSPKKIARTDEKGGFVLEDVPVGRHRVLISKEGYEEVMVTDIVVALGKRMLLKVGLDEAVEQSAGKKESNKAPTPNMLIAKTTKDKPNNQMAGISARPFTIEEVTRFAGARFDPARMVTNYAGAAGYDDSRNDIVIRGNSPNMILWQIEGLPIENPNHVTTIGTAGGVTPILNVYALDRADFMTGAFAAQYGNSIGGVFDLKLREGDDQKLGGMGQLGTQRAELIFEGPLGRKGNGSSFLLSLRASTGNYLLSNIIPTDPEHQDFNLKLTTGRKKWGELEVFAIGGRSRVIFPYEMNTYPDSNSSFLLNYQDRAFYNKVKYDIFEYEDYDHISLMGLGGLKYTAHIGKRSFWRTIAGASIHRNYVRWTLNIEDADGNLEEQATSYSVDDSRNNYMMHSYLQSKLNRYFTIKGGVLGNVYDLFLKEVYQYDGTIDYDYNGMFALLQAYVQAKYHVTNNFALHFGVHSQYLTLNNQIAVEPRLALNWEFVNGHILSLGYGMHSQMPSYLSLFFQPWLDEEDDYYYEHKNELKFIRSQHFVASYDWLINQNLRLRLEGYMQLLSNAPVEQDSSSYSALNIGASFYDPYTTPLESTGKGQNWGVEMTLEKFFSHNYYGLLSASFFDSKYQGSNGVWHNTLFNNRYIANLLVGKEFLFGLTKQNAVFVDARFSTVGGKPYTPIDLDATFAIDGEEEIYQDDLTNAKRLRAFYQVDLKVGMRINAGRLTHSFKIDLFNVLNIKNPLTVRYSDRFNPLGTALVRGTEQVIYQRGFIPDIVYTIQF